MITSNETPKSPRRASWGLMCRHPAHWLAFGFGSGLAPVAPGTFGTLAAFPLYWLLAPWAHGIVYLAIVAAMLLIGLPACARTCQAMCMHDPGAIVWDEIVAFLLVLFFVPHQAVWMLVAFGLFRLFDAAKPFPIHLADRHIKGAFGIMFDDLLAAGYAILAFKIIYWAAGYFRGVPSLTS